MLYSALVDADFVETEAQFQGDQSGKYYRAPGPSLNATDCLETLLDYLKQLNKTSVAASTISELRSDLLRACLKAAIELPGLFTLSAPTGSGKTLSMLAFALKHAAIYAKRRIIVAIPYLSIIEQTRGLKRLPRHDSCNNRASPPARGAWIETKVPQHHEFVLIILKPEGPATGSKE